MDDGAEIERLATSRTLPSSMHTRGAGCLAVPAWNLPPAGHMPIGSKPVSTPRSGRRWHLQCLLHTSTADAPLPIQSRVCGQKGKRVSGSTAWGRGGRKSRVVPHEPNSRAPESRVNCSKEAHSHWDPGLPEILRQKTQPGFFLAGPFMKGTPSAWRAKRVGSTRPRAEK